MKILLATLCLNEEEFLWDSFNQHIGWPGLVGWCFVESACYSYSEANPDAVTARGLSVDGTTEHLRRLANGDPRVRHISHGWAIGTPAQEKCESRNRYLEFADKIKPDAIIVIDADEFYTRADQQRINEVVASMPHISSFCFRQRHLWRPPSIAASTSRTANEVHGGYWQEKHIRVWRWREGMRYGANHNTPQDHNGTLWTQHTFWAESANQDIRWPQCVHFGFARDGEHRKRTNRYYQARGEGREPHGQFNRQAYVDCRAAWETWKPGDELPHGAKLIPYDGPIPEVFSACR